MFSVLFLFVLLQDRRKRRLSRSLCWRALFCAAYPRQLIRHSPAAVASCLDWPELLFKVRGALSSTYPEPLWEHSVQRGVFGLSAWGFWPSINSRQAHSLSVWSVESEAYETTVQKSFAGVGDFHRSWLSRQTAFDGRSCALSTQVIDVQGLNCIELGLIKCYCVSWGLYAVHPTFKRAWQGYRTALPTFPYCSQ